MRPYIFFRGPRPSQQSLQQTWVENAIDEGPLPIHDHRRPGRRFDIRDQDPSAADLRIYQQQLADSNSTGELLTFRHKQSGWHAHPYPCHSKQDIKRKPSDFCDLPDTCLPLCPHAANPLRTEDECRMRPHTHRHKSAGVVHYLQVPPEMHACSFIAVLKDHSSAVIKKEEVKEETITPVKEETTVTPSISRIQRKRELKWESTLIKTEVLGNPLRAMSSRRSKPARAVSAPRLKREYALLSMDSSSPALAGPSSAVAGPSYAPIIIDDDDIPGLVRSSPTPMEWPKARRLHGARTPGLTTYTAAEAEANLVGDQYLRELIRGRTTEILASHDFNRNVWLQEAAGDFPLRLSAYRPGSSLALRITAASDFAATPVGVFISALANTHGVLGLSFDHLLNLLRACYGCGHHFTPAGFNHHLVRDGNDFRCGNHPGRAVVGRVGGSKPYEALLQPRPYPRPAGGQDERERVRYNDFDLTTALGLALSALNTKLGLPDDIWEAVRSGIVVCDDCACVRSVHAHLDHLRGGTCGDLPGGPFFIAVASDEVALIGSNNERTILTVDE
ncbi:hypothetical protein B0H12DRAFT_1074018 [Mycena haematopus]|nr:hypothetical protein B0H12DRAFT_1074018 [Mycena haematopus]